MKIDIKHIEKIRWPKKEELFNITKRVMVILAFFTLFFISCNLLATKIFS